MIDEKNMTDDLNELAQMWLTAKENEATATSDHGQAWPPFFFYY